VRTAIKYRAKIFFGAKKEKIFSKASLNFSMVSLGC
jgi:hypothetical protein